MDIDGWTIRDEGSDLHVIANGGPMLVPAGGAIVLGRNSDPGENGGYTADYVYTGMNLANGDDESPAACVSTWRRLERFRRALGSGWS